MMRINVKAIAQPPAERNVVSDYVPPLRYRFLTRFYDPIVRITANEARFKVRSRFDAVRETCRFTAPLGTIALLRSVKP